jgi:hypothetical protein
MRFTYNSMWLQQTSFRYYINFSVPRQSRHTVECFPRQHAHVDLGTKLFADSKMLSRQTGDYNRKMFRLCYEVRRDEQGLTISRLLILGTIIYTDSGRGIAQSICEITEVWPWDCLQVVKLPSGREIAFRSWDFLQVVRFPSGREISFRSW